MVGGLSRKTNNTKTNNTKTNNTDWVKLITQMGGFSPETNTGFE